MLRKILSRIVNYLYFKLNRKGDNGGEYYCPVCLRSIRNFRPLPSELLESWDIHGYVHSIFLFETLNILKYTCPSCGANDRDRLNALFLKENLIKREDEQVQVLDIAPAPSLSKFLKEFNIIYRSADLFMKHVDDKVDVTNMKIYEDNRFDVIICSHVLEHVKEDRKAMAELFRVLKPGGFAILMAPILLSITETLEENDSTTIAERWKNFGQDDHVRMYSKSGFTTRLKDSGFRLRELGVGYFGEDCFRISGINKRSVLYIGEK